MQAWMMRGRKLSRELEENDPVNNPVLGI
jgi:hypothetical protein